MPERRGKGKAALRCKKGQEKRWKLLKRGCVRSLETCCVVCNSGSQFSSVLLAQDILNFVAALSNLKNTEEKHIFSANAALLHNYKNGSVRLFMGIKCIGSNNRNYHIIPLWQHRCIPWSPSIDRNTEKCMSARSHLYFTQLPGVTELPLLNY